MAGKMAGKYDWNENDRILRRGLGVYLFGFTVFFVEPAVGIEPTTC